jgi:hypothetical protein
VEGKRVGRRVGGGGGGGGKKKKEEKEGKREKEKIVSFVCAAFALCHKQQQYINSSTKLYSFFFSS